MTRSIEATPVTERTLLVESIASPRALATAASSLPDMLAGNELALFISYNFADVPIGTAFDCCYAAAEESNVRWVRTEVVAVTQQFAKPFEEIPHGWKTITVLRFDPELPDLVSELPVSDAWFESPITVPDFVARDLASAPGRYAGGIGRDPLGCS